jgi:hypothetical protein
MARGEFPTKGFRGLTLRLYDTEREEWSLYWVSSRTGQLTTPVVGRFVDGRASSTGMTPRGGRRAAGVRGRRRAR